mmetsp:Transcript_26059/g.54363  ORF Transcript_26059/g.54363 Transcript_26059/m.54363 type:complete len:242 (-) Transcript_26059:1143-1868(-)
MLKCAFGNAYLSSRRCQSRPRIGSLTSKLGGSISLSIRGPTLASSGRSAHSSRERGMYRFGSGKVRELASRYGALPSAPLQQSRSFFSKSERKYSTSYHCSVFSCFEGSELSSISAQAASLDRSIIQLLKTREDVNFSKSDSGKVDASSCSMYPALMLAAVPCDMIDCAKLGHRPYTDPGDVSSKKMRFKAIFSSQIRDSSEDFPFFAARPSKWRNRQYCNITSTTSFQRFSPFSVNEIST